MRISDIPFKLCEELLDTTLYLVDTVGRVDKQLVIKAIAKNDRYLKRATSVLFQLEILEQSGDHFQFSEIYLRGRIGSGEAILKTALRAFAPLKQYEEVLRDGKSKSSALKLVKAVHSIANEVSDIERLFVKYQRYLQSKELLIAAPENVPNKTGAIPIKALVTFTSLTFIDSGRIHGLKNIPSTTFDLSKLIRICEELNDAYQRGNFYSVGLLVRVILDHIPPVFGKRTFIEVANNHGTKSFRDVMIGLETFNRKIADGFLHSHIKKRDSLPNSNTIDCRNAIDVLLGEVINDLRH